MIHSTFVRTRDGQTYDLGRAEHPPRRCASHPVEQVCAACKVVNAWTAPARATAPLDNELFTATERNPGVFRDAFLDAPVATTGPRK